MRLHLRRLTHYAMLALLSGFLCILTWAGFFSHLDTDVKNTSLDAFFTFFSAALGFVVGRQAK